MTTTRQQQQTPLTSARITALVSLGTLLCCLCCCAVPGALMLGVLNSVSEEWPVVEATLLDKIDCHSDFDSDSNSDSDSDSNSDSSSNSSSESESESDDQEEDPTYYLTYNYMTLDGENITSTTDYCTSLILTTATTSDDSSTSSIRYNPNDPTEILDSLLVSIGLGVSRIVTGIGWTVVIVALGLTILCCRSWGQQKPPNNSNNNNNINTNTTSNNNNTNTNNNNTNNNNNNDIEIPSIVNNPNKPIYATAVANSNSNNNHDIEIPSIVNDLNKPIYATAVAVPIGDSYDAGIVRYK